MKNLTSKALIAFTTLLIMSACSMTKASPEDYRKITKENLTLKKINALITETAEQNGWRITPFKYNKLVAEKVGDSSVTTVTITFTTDSFKLSPANSDLEDILREALN